MSTVCYTLTRFARALITAQHPDKCLECSTGVCRENSDRINSVACEKVREGKSEGSPGVQWAPGVAAKWLTLVLVEAVRGPATRSREIGGREYHNI